MAQSLEASVWREDMRKLRITPAIFLNPDHFTSNNPAIFTAKSTDFPGLYDDLDPTMLYQLNTYIEDGNYTELIHLCYIFWMFCGQAWTLRLKTMYLVLHNYLDFLIKTHWAATQVQDNPKTHWAIDWIRGNALRYL